MGGNGVKIHREVNYRRSGPLKVMGVGGGNGGRYLVKKTPIRFSHFGLHKGFLKCTGSSERGGFGVYQERGRKTVARSLLWGGGSKM